MPTHYSGNVDASMGESHKCAEVHEKYRDLYRNMEHADAPGAMPGESPSQYRRRLLAGVQKFSKAYADADLIDRRLPENVVDGLEVQILADATATLSDRSVGSFRKPGELRKIVVRSDGGHVVHEYSGDPSCWIDAFSHPRQMVSDFMDYRKAQMGGWR